MKRKVIILIILATALLGILLTCTSQSEQFVGEFRQCIPDIKTFIMENEEVLMKLRALLRDDKEMRIYVFRDAAIKNYDIIIEEYDVDTEAFLRSSFDDSSVFSEEEKGLFRTVFTFSSRDVNINRIDVDGGCFGFTSKNLVYMDLVHDDGSSYSSIIVKQKKDSSDYWEEILNNWYVFIIVSRPY